MREYVSDQRAKGRQMHSLRQKYILYERTTSCDMMEKKGERNEHLTVVAISRRKNVGIYVGTFLKSVFPNVSLCT